MTALIIIAAIAMFFIILLLCPIIVYTSFEESFFAKARYLFFTYTIYPQKKEKKEKEKKKSAAPAAENKEKKDKTSSIGELIKEKGVNGFLDLLKEIASLAAGVAKTVCKHIVISQFSVRLCMVGEDAADTALQFGYAGSVVYPAASIIFANTRCKNYEIQIVPGFEEKKSYVHFHAKLHISLWYLVHAALTALLRYVVYIVKQRIQSNKIDK